MCGLAGILDLRGAGRASLDTAQRMAEAIGHRGPDDATGTQAGHLAVAFRRLSIVDVAGGAQPFWSEDGRYVAVCNGEVFDHERLRRRLEAAGHCFATGSDCEVLVHLFEERGHSCMHELNGQFAFVVHDTVTGRLFAARDHAGIVPLFHAVVDGLFLFGSEIKAVLAHGGLSRRLDLVGLDQTLSLTGPVSPRTAFQGVHSLPGGSWLEVGDGLREPRIQQYWDLRPPSAEERAAQVGPGDVDAVVDELGAALHRAVIRRTQGDLPVGLYVSGGLDSAVVASVLVAADAGRVRRRSFGVAVADPRLDETGHQRRVACHLGLDHHHVPFRGDDVVELLPRAVWHAECPLKETIDAGALALSGRVRDEGVKVVLGGQGADELFAGYVGYRFDAFRSLRDDVAPSEEERRIRRQLWGVEDFVYEKDQAAFLGEKRRLLSTDARAALAEEDFSAFPPVSHNRLQGLHPLDRRTYVDFKLRLGDHLLADHGDRMAMANSVELRHPFLDPEVVDLAIRMPPLHKLRDFEEKYVLKRLGERFLPSSVVWREKFGFATPGSDVLVRSSSEWVRTLLDPATVARHGVFDPATVSRLAQRACRPEYQVNVPFEEDLLVVVLSTGLLIEQFGLDGF